MNRLRWTCLLATLVTANLLWITQTGQFSPPIRKCLYAQASSLLKVVKHEAKSLPQEPETPGQEDRSFNDDSRINERDKPEELAIFEDDVWEAREARRENGDGRTARS